MNRLEINRGTSHPNLFMNRFFSEEQLDSWLKAWITMIYFSESKDILFPG